MVLMIFLTYLYIIIAEDLPNGIVVMNESMLNTWYDPIQVCMIQDKDNYEGTHNNIEHAWHCSAKVAKSMNTTEVKHRYTNGFGLLPHRKPRDGCCTSDFKSSERGFDWVWPGYENGSTVKVCVEMLDLLSRRGMSLMFIGDSMNNQVFRAFTEECVREGIPDSAFADIKRWLPFLDDNPVGGIRLLNQAQKFDWTQEMNVLLPSKNDDHGNDDNNNKAKYNYDDNTAVSRDRVMLYAIDLWYGRRSDEGERDVMEALIPYILKQHPNGIVILPNIGHHLDFERRSHSKYLVTAIGAFLGWMNELSYLNRGNNLVLFRETTPAHFDSPEQDGSYESWEKNGGDRKYDYEGYNSWDIEPRSKYHCRAINTSYLMSPSGNKGNARSGIRDVKNTKENILVSNIFDSWRSEGPSNMKMDILPVYKYLAPFYRLKYAFCGPEDR